jgi:hypothetical protein
MGNIEGATDQLYGSFPNANRKPITFGQVQLHNGARLNYFIETGRASMVMIYGVRTLIGLSGKGNGAN